MLMVESVSAVSWLEEQPERLTRQADRRTAAAILFTNRLIYMSPLFKPCHASWKDGPHFCVQHLKSGDHSLTGLFCLDDVIYITSLCSSNSAGLHSGIFSGFLFDHCNCVICSSISFAYMILTASAGSIVPITAFGQA